MNDNASPQNSPADSNRLWPLLGGLALIAMGIVFLVQNFTGLRLGNWWVLFIFIPAIGMAARAWQIYQSNGKQFTQSIAGMAISVLMLLAIASLFVFNLDWGKVWPVFIILAGVAALVRALVAKPS